MLKISRMSVEGDGTPFRGGLLMGPARGSDPVEIVDYDPLWVARFEDMRDRLTAALGPLALRIDHVGSTAVPGLAAKPVVDIQLSVANVEDTEAYREQIEELGFALRYVEPGHRYFRPRPGVPRLWQVHVCQAGSKWERDHLLFRDFLRAHADEAQAYAALKLDMAALHPDDRIAYNDAKTPWITAALERAEAWAAKTGWLVEKAAAGTSSATTSPIHTRARFVAGFGPIVRDVPASLSWWQAATGMDLPAIAPNYHGTDDLDGVRAFALWPLSDAAQSTFGTHEWPAGLPLPQAWLELDVESAAAVAQKAAELVTAGHQLLRDAREEPWGQTTARLQSPEGILVGITFTPWMHGEPDAAGATGTADEP